MTRACVLALATVVSALLAGCASPLMQVSELPNRQHVAFVTSKADIFGAAPTTVVFAQDKPWARVYRPIGITSGQAGETTALGAIGGGLANGVGYGIAARIGNFGSGSGGGNIAANSVNIKVKSSANAGGGTAVICSNAKC